MSKDEALKQIIDLIQPVAALGHGTLFEHSEVIQRCVDAVEIALEALAQPVQEPAGDEWTPCMKLPVVVHVRKQRPGEAHVSTREGITPVKTDDLIMRGVSGEEYPIGRAIFEQTYSLDTTPPLPVQPDQSVAGYCKKIAELIAERDSLRAALAQPFLPVQPVQEPVAWEQFHEHLVERNFCQRCGKRTADLATIHTCTPPIAADPQAFHGFPHGPVSTPNAGGKCVTAGETAPNTNKGQNV